MATEKQIGYALALLNKAGYSTKYMDSDFKRLGATCRERSGSVRGWLSQMEKVEISALIDRLKSILEGGNEEEGNEDGGNKDGDGPME